MFLFIVPVILLIHLAKSSANFPGSADEIKSLPGLQTPPKFRHYSGYLNASTGRYLFYWLFENQNNSQNAPLIQYISGGPGGSAVGDMLIGRTGPWRIIDNGTRLVDSDRSWNRFANLLLIDSPVGVGFSYEDNSSYVHDDQTTAKDMLLALKSFFKKFPHFQKNEFYLTGSSYAGIYIPHLAREIVRNNDKVDNQTKINLKGLSIANGELNGMERHAITGLYFQRNNGMICRKSWLQLHSACGCEPLQKVNQFCNFYQATNKSACRSNLTRIFNQIYNPNYIYIKNKYRVEYDYEKADNPQAIDAYNIYQPAKFCRNWNQTDSELKEFLSYYQRSLNGMNFMKTLAEDDCIDIVSIGRFLLNPKVGKALNARRPFGDLNFSMECFGPYKEGCTYKVFEGSTDDMFKELIRSKLNITIYNGDWDLVCDYLSSEWLLERLALPIVKDYRRWVVDNRVVGFTRKYAQGLTYVNVRGAGHSALVNKPKVIELITKFMIGKAEIN